jgi:hypothetical protein
LLGDCAAYAAKYLVKDISRGDEHPRHRGAEEGKSGGDRQ